MAGEFELQLGQPAKRPPGRPKGSGNKRSGDLRAYIEAHYDGRTPAMAAAQVALVSAKELKAAGGDAIAAMVTKAKHLAEQLGCKTSEAWKLMADERRDLMPYLHQRLAQLDITGQVEVGLPVILMPDAPHEQNQGVIEGVGWEVSPAGSHDDDEP
jgi:hypothetical protein